MNRLVDRGTRQEGRRRPLRCLTPLLALLLSLVGCDRRGFSEQQASEPERSVVRSEPRASPAPTVHVIVDAAEGMLVACGRGAVWIREVKPAGKRRMTTAEWAQGRAIAVGDQLR